MEIQTHHVYLVFLKCWPGVWQGNKVSVTLLVSVNRCWPLVIGATFSFRNVSWVLCGVLLSSLLVNHNYPHWCLFGQQSLSPTIPRWSRRLSTLFIHYLNPLNVTHPSRRSEFTQHQGFSDSLLPHLGLSLFNVLSALSSSKIILDRNDWRNLGVYHQHWPISWKQPCSLTFHVRR